MKDGIMLVNSPKNIKKNKNLLTKQKIRLGLKKLMPIYL